MKDEIHPDYVAAHVRCTCGQWFITRSTKDDIHVESARSATVYTGRQKLMTRVTRRALQASQAKAGKSN